MCASIQRQIEAQRVQSQQIIQATPQSTHFAYRTETTMEAQTRQVKRCNGRTCWYETVTEMVPVTRQVPISQPVVASKPVVAKPVPAVDMLANTELVPTPQPVVVAMLEELAPSNKAKLFDLGSGDGRIVISAAKLFGCTAVGIELNPETIKIARTNAITEYVNPLVVFFEGDVRNYDLASAQYVTMYLYPELMAQVVPKMKPGTQIASYQHEIPGVANTKHSIDVNGQAHIYYTGTKL
jgi:2-polyprenyl-3-methyl-5-hydroxy-6-metoxy-1,4-benzoquinol methylase